MKVGDLVREIHAHGLVDRDLSVGVVVEWDIATAELPASGWVWWHGDVDWSIVYVDDIEVLSEAG